MSTNRIARIHTPVESARLRNRRVSRQLQRLRDRETFTPEQTVVLQAIKVAALRFEAHESTLLRATIESLALALDAWATAHNARPVAYELGRGNA